MVYSLVVLFFYFNSTHANIYTNVLNTSVVEQLEFTHSVPRKSNFSGKQLSSQVEDNQQIIRFHLENNTRDGFKLSISTQNDGFLVSNSNNDGEFPIPYGLRVTFNGDLGPETTTKTQFDNTDFKLNSSQNIFNAENQTSASIVSGVVLLSIEDEWNQLNMAETYLDRVILTYEDY